MFSFARAEQAAGGEALLLTGDRDLYGAVGDGVSVVELSKGVISGLIDAARRVGERYGVDPEQVPDFIALRGDPSDGLPGAPGVGAKTAAELLREHGTLEGVIAAARDVNSARARPAKPLQRQDRRIDRRERGPAGGLQGDRDAADGRGQAPGRAADRPCRRRAGRRGAGHAPPGRAAGEDG